ncbi:short-chain-enoyl-CoA hydratase [Neobacillus niacini]|uniref:short-chain-enoyl-CoA hydratase n=1 Tax=Neobacillus niacini TaxID=86668 RepID=UPI00300054D5
MFFQHLLYEKAGNVGLIKINRPDALNALNSEVLYELSDVFELVENDEEIRVIVLTGEGKAFVAGADVSEMKGMSSKQARKFSTLGLNLFRRMELLEKPVIAAINGFALGGGCELALSCDIRISSEKAKFGQPEVGLGITPGFGGTQRLPRLIGTAMAKELIFTGNMINAEEAKSIGLVNRVVAPESLMEETLKLANKIASVSSTAVAYAKVAINRGVETDIDTGIEVEKDVFTLCFAEEDQEEGMSAFLEKRQPAFK